MSGELVEWPRVMRTPPTDSELVAEAAASPGGFVAVIDVEVAGVDQDGYVPAEAVHGVWVVGPGGELTGEYAENPLHGVPVDDFSALTGMDHYWGWLPDEPAAAVRGAMQELLADQVPGAVVEWMKVTEAPEVVTGGRPHPEKEGHLVVVRAAAAVPFALSVRAPDEQRDILWGVITWAASGLDEPEKRQDQLWLDLETKIESARERLSERVYEVEQS